MVQVSLFDKLGSQTSSNLMPEVELSTSRERGHAKVGGMAQISIACTTIRLSSEMDNNQA